MNDYIDSPPARAEWVTTDQLNAVMEFDHVIRVHPGGDGAGAWVSAAPTDRREFWAPEVMDTEIVGDGQVAGLHPVYGWRLLTGYTGQYGYNGPGMHASEYIGGGLARDILAAPGLYVALTDQPGDDSEPEGWVVAHRALPEDQTEETP